MLVAQAPDLMFLKDTDGDDKADVRVRVLERPRLGRHAPHVQQLRARSGRRALLPGRDVPPHAGRDAVRPAACAAPTPASSATSRATQKFDVYVTYGFANPHGHVFDRWGQDIVVDGTGANPYHGDPLLRPPRLSRRSTPQPPQVYQQRTRPCPGVEILSSRHFPEENQGNLLVANVIGFQGILQYKIEDKGASFAGTEVEPIVSSTDPNFRPSDLKIGPDGAIYFIDWQNPIIGHMQHNLRDPSRDRDARPHLPRHLRGPAAARSPSKIAGEPIEKLLDLLKEPEDRVRYRARIELGGRDTRRGHRRR